MQKREFGIDLLRVLALMFVVSLHMFSFCGFHDEPQYGAALWLANSWRIVCFACIPLFLLITGYLKSVKPINAKYFISLIPILVGFALSTGAVYIAYTLVGGHTFSVFTLARRVIQFLDYGWYVEMYIGLILISPLINFGLEKIEKPKYLVAVSAVMLTLTALPTLLPYNIAPDYWQALYPFTFYIIGAVIRRLKPRINPAFCLLAMPVAMFFSAINMKKMNGEFTNGYSMGNGGFWMTAVAVIIFLSLYHIDARGGVAKLLAFAAGGVFEGYLLSQLFDLCLYQLVPALHTPNRYALLWLCISLPIAVISILCGKVIHFAAVKISRPVENVIYKVLNDKKA